MKITHTGWYVEIWCKKSNSAANRRHGKQFNQRIERAIRIAILKAARLQIREFVRSGRLDKGFGVDMEP
jgi:hypothetical protein